MGKLTALKVTRLSRPGRYGDGGGLWLQVRLLKKKNDEEHVGKSWLFRYTLRGRARHMGLGDAADVSLAEARELAGACRKQLRDGVDPIEARESARRQAAFEAASAVTFKDAAERYIAAHRAAWRNPKHRQQWANTLSSYAYPVLGEVSIAAVDTGLILKVLEPLWTAKAETASRLRGRIEAVLDWARARGHRDGDNPARWRGHLDQLLPDRKKVRTVRHHPALPYAELPAFMIALREREGVSARALEFLILTAARTSEVIGARPAEIDGKTWIIPSERMKSRREHRVPLSSRALDILEDLPRRGDVLFPGGRDGEPLSNMALLATLKRMERGDLTAHGFRSTFRDWAAERTNFPREVAEAALAHTVPDKVEAAYRRGDFFDKRRRLMDAWAGYCNAAPADVVSISRVS